jgi:hypothetical protein
MSTPTPLSNAAALGQMQAPLSASAHDCFARPGVARPTIELATERFDGCADGRDSFAADAIVWLGSTGTIGIATERSSDLPVAGDPLAAVATVGLLRDGRPLRRRRDPALAGSWRR